MNSGNRVIRRAFTVWLKTLLLVLSVTVPIMERADLDHHERFETTHHAGVCAPAHDHTICAQLGANLSLPAQASTYRPTLQISTAARGRGLAFVDRRAHREGHPTRAPPSV